MWLLSVNSKRSEDTQTHKCILNIYKSLFFSSYLILAFTSHYVKSGAIVLHDGYNLMWQVTM